MIPIPALDLIKDSHKGETYQFTIYEDYMKIIRSFFIIFFFLDTIIQSLIIYIYILI